VLGLGGMASLGDAWHAAIEDGSASGTFATHRSFAQPRAFANLSAPRVLATQAGTFAAERGSLNSKPARFAWLMRTAVDVAATPLRLFGTLIKFGLSAFGTAIRHLAGSGSAPETESVGLPYDGRIPLQLYLAPLDGSGGSAIGVEDVNQGTLGSCVTLSGIAAVALQNPALIEDAIRDNGDGTFTVRFHVQRPPLFFWEPAWTTREVTVDARVPLNEHGHPAFAGARSGELWVLILEKAWAELNGGWAHINGDLGFGLLEALTGQSASANYSIRGVSFGAGERSPAYLARLLDDGYAILASSLKKTTDGVTDGHTHYIKSVDAQGNVTLGNPWGDDEEITISWDAFERNFSRIEFAATR
jgi:hypothetical protein